MGCRYFGQKGNNWIEALKQWVRDAHHAEKLAVSNDYDEIKSFVGKIGTNRLLTNKNASLALGDRRCVLSEKSENSSWLVRRDALRLHGTRLIGARTCTLVPVRTPFVLAKAITGASKPSKNSP